MVRETRRSREDIDVALDAMLRRQELPGGRVPVQTTERLFRESVPVLRKLLENQDSILKSLLYSVFHVLSVLGHLLLRMYGRPMSPARPCQLQASDWLAFCRPSRLSTLPCCHMRISFWSGIVLAGP